MFPLSTIFEWLTGLLKPSKLTKFFKELPSPKNPGCFSALRASSSIDSSVCGWKVESSDTKAISKYPIFGSMLSKEFVYGAKNPNAMSPKASW